MCTLPSLSLLVRKKRGQLCLWIATIKITFDFSPQSTITIPFDPSSVSSNDIAEEQKVVPPYVIQAKFKKAIQTV